MPLDILLKRQEVLADLLETCNRELEELCPEYEKPIKPVEVETGNGYFETYYGHNESSFTEFIKGLQEYIQDTKNSYTDYEDSHLGKTEREEIEYAIQDILGVIYSESENG